jgi:hypothetical protein
MDGGITCQSYEHTGQEWKLEKQQPKQPTATLSKTLDVYAFLNQWTREQLEKK